MGNSILKEANNLYTKGDYTAARENYIAAYDLYKSPSIKLNIYLCEKKLKGIKSTISVNNTFDQIYVVNMPHQYVRRYNVIQRLLENKISFKVIDGVNGYFGEPKRIFDNYRVRKLGDLKKFRDFNDREIARGKGFIESEGAIGYIYTYTKVIEEARSRGLKRILILEDDIILTKDFKTEFSRFAENIEDDWKIILLGASQYDWSSVDVQEAATKGMYSPRQIHTCGSFAIGIDHSVFDEIIELANTFESPFDLLPLGSLYEKYHGKCFVAYPNLVVADVTDSSIRGPRQQLEHAERMRWDMTRFEFPARQRLIGVRIKSLKTLEELSKNKDQLEGKFLFYYFTSDGPRPVHLASIRDAQLLGMVEAPPNFKIRDTILDVEVSAGRRLDAFDLHRIAESELVYLGQRGELDLSLGFVPGRASIVLPTFKRPENLYVASQSVLQQDYDDIELIIVDDNGEGSEFNESVLGVVEKLLSEYGERNIRYIPHKINRNGASSRNTGIFSSTGEYISFLDDDDLYLDGRISKSVHALKLLGEQVGAVYCGYLGWNSKADDPSRYVAGDLTQQLLELRFSEHYLHTNTATYRRSVVTKLGGFDETYRRHQDLEFNLRFFRHSEMGVVRCPLVRLKPAPSGVDNRVFGLDFLRLKEKFLGQFNDLICSMGEESARRIYGRHWEEVLRYLGKQDALDTAFEERFANGPLQLLGMLKARDV